MNTFPRHLRTLGLVMMGLGIIIPVGYFIDPLHLAWAWARSLPLPLQIGLGAASLGFSILSISLLVERFRERTYDQSLKDKDL